MWSRTHTYNARAGMRPNSKAKSKAKARATAKAKAGGKNCKSRTRPKDTRDRKGRKQDRKGRKQKRGRRDRLRMQTLRTLNFQRPWAQLLVRGVKTVEVRTYPMRNRQGEDHYVEETGGKKAPRGFKNAIVGTIRFKGDFKYTSYQPFRDDEARHCILAGSEFDWDQSTNGDPKCRTMPPSRILM